MTNLTPTVGRVVWYYPKGWRAGEQPLAAIIAHVWSDRCVNLAIFDANGKAIVDPPTSIELCHPEEDNDNQGKARWMPYQVGQAAKTEQLEKKLSDLK